MIAVLFAPAAGIACEDDAQSMQQRLVSLEKQIDRLDDSRRASWIAEQRAQKVRAIAREVLADAGMRASFASQAATTGYRGGFFIEDPDGRFRLRVSGFTQLRYVFNHQGGSQPNADDFGFDLRRVRIKFDGHVVNEHIGYKIGGSYDRGGVGGMELSDAFITLGMSDALEFQVGRFRPALLREDGHSAKRLPMIERSLVRAAFAEDRRAGAALNWTGDRWRVSVGAFDDMPGFEDANAWRARGRVEFLAQGDSWRSQRDATGFRGEEDSLMFGGGIGYADGRLLPGAGMPESNTFTWTADGTWQSDGWSVFAAVVGAAVQTDGMRDQHPIGCVIQGGVFICKDTQLLSRFQWGDADDGSADLSMLTVGVTHFISGHNLKVGCDVGYAFNQVGSFWSSGGAAVRADAVGTDGQIVVRGQLQIVY